MKLKEQSTPIQVPYTNFPLQMRQCKSEILSAIEHVLARGDFILGKEVSKFEKRFASLCGVKHAIGVANGTDALILALKALEIGHGDEVITQPNSWISTTSSIALVGARPVFVDVLDDLNINCSLIEKVITPKTKAILPAHLAGKCADMAQILKIAKEHNLLVIEDAAQAVNATLAGKKAGSFGIIGCFSLHPLKNLNAIGDAGALTTNDDQLAQKLKLMRNHGLQDRDHVLFWGHNSRLDSIQAAVLNVRFNLLDQVTKIRREHAAHYRERLAKVVECPKESKENYSIYHLFVIQCNERDRLKTFLETKGIDTRIHYPTPIHLQPCSRYLGYHEGDFPVAEKQSRRILSLPVHDRLTKDQIDYVCDAIVKFYS